jgi:hypothetical protein
MRHSTEPIVMASNVTYSLPIDDSRWIRRAVGLRDGYDQVYTKGTRRGLCSPTAILPPVQL